jgi:LPS-assembly lipoprotein
MTRFLRMAMTAGVLALGLSGCFRPLYGSAEFGGLAVQQGLAGVKVEIEGERLAHYLRNELEFGLRGGDPNAAPVTHRLVVSAKQNVSSAVIDRLTGAAESAVMTIDARYILYPAGKTTVVTEGDAKAVVSYDRSQQRFASVRAARDAEIQGAKQLAEQIKTRIAAHLASTR